jgi:hypothetical protein
MKLALSKPLSFGGGFCCLAAALISNTATDAREPYRGRPGESLYSAARQEQQIGSVLVDPGGSFFLFEWSRPYDWTPLRTGLNSRVSSRPQTLLFKVVPNNSAFFPAAAHPLFPMAPGATYYLGPLSPDGRWVGFYELDRDNNAARAGAAEISTRIPPRIIWFDVSPDRNRLDQLPKWESATSMLFPIQGSRQIGRGDIANGHTSACACPLGALINPQPSTTKSTSNVPAGFRTAASNTNGTLTVFVKSDPQQLSLRYRWQGRDFTLFENSRANSS